MCISITVMNIRIMKQNNVQVLASFGYEPEKIHLRWVFKYL